MSDTQEIVNILTELISTHITHETESLKKKLMEVEQDRDLLEKRLISYIGTIELEKIRRDAMIDRFSQSIKNSSRKN